MGKWTRVVMAAVLLLGAAGCATTSGGGDARDPLEGFNRSMYSFNDGFDNAIGKPVATAYRDVIPSPIRSGVRNFFSNIADIWIAINNLLQGKPIEAAQDVARVALNSTLGLLGFLDFASEVGIEKHDEDFGQTFGRWGVGDGPYVVWPFLGPSNARDSVGTLLDFYVDPVLDHKPKGVRYALATLRVTGKRADLLDASRILEEAALDKYVFQRDAYIQRRRSQINDGNMPRSEGEAPRRAGDEAPRSEAAPGVDAAVQLIEEPAQAAGRGG